MFNSTGTVAPTKQINDPQRLLTEVEQTVVVSLCYTNLGYTYMKSKMFFIVKVETMYIFQPFVISLKILFASVYYWSFGLQVT